MIKVSVSYAHDPVAPFDWDYYLQRHVPLVKRLLGTALKGLSIERGLAGGAPGSAPAYQAQAHFLFESIDAFQSAFGPHGEAIARDTAAYTSIEPSIQINEVCISGRGDPEAHRSLRF